MCSSNTVAELYNIVKHFCGTKFPKTYYYYYYVTELNTFKQRLYFSVSSSYPFFETYSMNVVEINRRAWFTPCHKKTTVVALGTLKVAGTVCSLHERNVFLSNPGLSCLLKQSQFMYENQKCDELTNFNHPIWPSSHQVMNESLQSEKSMGFSNGTLFLLTFSFFFSF